MSAAGKPIWTCGRVPQAHAYHDGELPEEARQSFEEHVQGCAACAGELAALRRISRLVAAAPLPDLPDGLRERLRRLAVRAPQHAIVRLAERLTAAAAAVVVVCTGLLWADVRPRRAPAPLPETWELAAAMPASERPAGDAQHIAQWVLVDLSRENGGE